METINLQNLSQMVSYANYDPGTNELLLTYQSGKTVIAYQGVEQKLFEELCSSSFPDACIRFKIQARHPFRRLNQSAE
ncbi:KTSC domain-containing protein [Lewinella sp. W8]|uniref:KTSC domain-containing protein n=1 Tax=Lewinella sp. W8 TaxID=2528208 RepID=UPI001068AFEE|nr:KTSC domain-containing protein [Lewinella sp. W8]MTB52200.1 KTSC domain-containing protein [Lewinella sp. W8]